MGAISATVELEDEIMAGDNGRNVGSDEGSKGGNGARGWCVDCYSYRLSSCKQCLSQPSS